VRAVVNYEVQRGAVELLLDYLGKPLAIRLIHLAESPHDVSEAPAGCVALDPPPHLGQRQPIYGYQPSRTRKLGEEQRAPATEGAELEDVLRPELTNQSDMTLHEAHGA
jgi:hypothetical protein